MPLIFKSFNIVQEKTRYVKRFYVFYEKLRVNRLANGYLPTVALAPYTPDVASWANGNVVFVYVHNDAYARIGQTVVIFEHKTGLVYAKNVAYFLKCATGLIFVT